MVHASDFRYDVILRTTKQVDKPRVRWLAERLRVAGRKPKAHYRRQNAAILHSSFFIHPFWAVGLERSTVGRGNLPFRDPSNAGRRFIPLLLADYKLPDTPRRVKREALRWTRDLLLPDHLSDRVNRETNSSSI